MKRMWLGLILAFVTTAAISATPGSPLEIVISHPESTREAESGVVIFTMTNRGDSPIYVFAPGTPYSSTNDRPNTDVFNVIDANGKKAKYIGLYVSMTYNASSYIKMNPGETLSKRVNLSKTYDLSAGGPFSVTFNRVVLGDPAEDALEEELYWNYVRARASGADAIDPTVSEHVIKPTTTSNTLDIWVNSALLIKGNDVGASSAEAMDTSEAEVCEASKQSVIDTALNRARALTGIAAQHLDEIKYSDLVFDGTDAAGMPIAVFYPKLKDDFLRNNWFGSYDDNWLPADDPGYLDTDNFYPTKVVGAIHERLYSRPISFDCSCPAAWGTTATTAAVALSNQKVGICDPFFTLDDTGFNTKAGALVHEASHFSDDLAPGTVDYVKDGQTMYGTGRAAALAQSDKSAAMRNADNYKFFVEGNSP